MKTGRWLALVLVLLLSAELSAERILLNNNIANGDTFMGIRLKGTLRLDGLSVDGIPLREMSGLAWSDTSQLLYGVSNDGRLYHLRPTFDADGNLSDLKLEKAYLLKDPSGKALSFSYRDSEGLELRTATNKKKSGETKESLIISFENKHRVDEYSLTGDWLDSYPTPKEFTERYTFYNSNSGMEAIVRHPQFGLLTATERALSTEPKGQRLIYALESEKRWAIPDSGVKNASIVAIDNLSNGDLLILERSYSSMFEPIIISLYRVALTPECAKEKGKLCDSSLLARFNSAEEWSIDNFEGLARHQGDRFYMISDNNKMWFQQTLLSYFEVLPANTAPNTTPKASSEEMAQQ